MMRQQTALQASLAEFKGSAHAGLPMVQQRDEKQLQTHALHKNTERLILASRLRC